MKNINIIHTQYMPIPRTVFVWYTKTTAFGTTSILRGSVLETIVRCDIYSVLMNCEIHLSTIVTIIEFILMKTHLCEILSIFNNSKYITYTLHCAFIYVKKCI